MAASRQQRPGGDVAAEESEAARGRAVGRPLRLLLRRGRRRRTLPPEGEAPLASCVVGHFAPTRTSVFRRYADFRRPKGLGVLLLTLGLLRLGLFGLVWQVLVRHCL